MAAEIDRISDLFNGKAVFISGATGFLGKVLVEKLLRVTEVKTLYLLIRQKKDKSPKDRLNDMFNHVLFSVLKKERPDSIKRCIVVPGDVTERDLGITESDRRTLQNEVDFIYHSAATTRFDDTLQYSVKMNTLGTKYMLNLAKECKKLKEDVLYEKTYDPPADPDEILNIISTSEEDMSTAEFEQRLLQDCPNTYTFSKALAEGLVNKEIDKLPLVIVRPAVVIPTLQEPFPGFFNNLQSPMGIFVGAGKGVIRSMYMDSHSYANLIPADSSINAILVASWDYLTTRQKNVFNICVPHQDLKINWEEIIEMGKEVVNNKVPFNGIIWYPGGVMTKSKWLHNFNVLLFQFVPAILIDLLLFCLGYKPVLFQVNQRLLKGQEMFEYYTTKSWNFDTSYFLKMRRLLNKKEKQKYKVEAENVNLEEYLCNSILYARRHIFKETDDMLPTAKRNMKIFFVMDRIAKVGFFVFIFYHIYNILFTRKLVF